MLGWLIGAALLGAAICYTISGLLTKSKAREVMAQEGIRDAFIKKINRTTNTLTLSELNGTKDVEIQADSIDSDLREGIVI